MGVLSRMNVIVKSKMTRILDKAEDPRETLDYAYDKQMEMLRNVKRGVVEMVTAKRRLEMQADKARQNVTKLEEQARQAMNAGREDLARLALQRKQTALIELGGLDEQVAGLELEQEKLTQNLRKATDAAVTEATTEFAELYARDIFALERKIHGFHTTRTDEPTLEIEKRFIHLWLQLLDAEIMRR